MSLEIQNRGLCGPKVGHMCPTKNFKKNNNTWGVYFPAYISNESLRHIEVLQKFIVENHCPKIYEDRIYIAD